MTWSKCPELFTVLHVGECAPKANGHGIIQQEPQSGLSRKEGEVGREDWGERTLGVGGKKSPDSHSPVPLPSLHDHPCLFCSSLSLLLFFSKQKCGEEVA